MNKEDAKELQLFIKAQGEAIQHLKDENKKLRAALGWCTEGLEGHFGNDFWKSRLGERLIEAGLIEAGLKDKT